MRHEIQKHWSKLKRISQLTEKELEEANYRILSKIHFINEELIPANLWLEAKTLVADIDIDDLDFIALAKYIKGYLWTGDKELYAGVKSKKFKRIYNTTELLQIKRQE